MSETDKKLTEPKDELDRLVDAGVATYAGAREMLRVGSSTNTAKSLSQDPMEDLGSQGSLRDVDDRDPHAIIAEEVRDPVLKKLVLAGLANSIKNRF